MGCQPCEQRQARLLELATAHSGWLVVGAVLIGLTIALWRPKNLIA